MPLVKQSRASKRKNGLKNVKKKKKETEARRGRDARGKIRDTEREAVLPPRPAIGSSPGNTKAFFGVSPAPHTHSLTHSH